MKGLRDLRVIESATGIAGPYAGKLFADAGADVIKLEGRDGDPLRRRTASGSQLNDSDGGLFRYLNASKRSVLDQITDTLDDSLESLLSGADLLIEDENPEAFDRAELRRRFPQLVILSVTPFGLTGPMSGRPANDFTLQAEGGSVGARAQPGGVPYQAGGEISGWAGGCFGAVAALAAVRYARQSGHGEQIDFSLHATTALITNCYLDMMWGILGRPPALGMLPNTESPSIEPTRDGFIGFTTYSAQQMSDFLLMINRPDLRESGEFDAIVQRIARLPEWQAIVNAYTLEHETQEIIELAQMLRVPVAPVCNGQTALEQAQLQARNIYHTDPEGDFKQPAAPYRIDGERPPPPRPAPRHGEHHGQIEPRSLKSIPSGETRQLPLSGIKILDATNWWAGPIATQMLGMLGAEVIHVESIQRIDGSRSVGGTFANQNPDWWECSFIYASANSNKRGLTVDLGDPQGKKIFKNLISQSDIVVENFSPRVMDEFGFEWESIQAMNPKALYVRMPAFGLEGPWREHVGFAATMEQMSGLSWLTGHVEDQPRIQRGPCDPIAGVHAAFAMLVALTERDQDQRGHFVECAMLEAAISVTAEQVIEFTRHGHLMERMGNRSEHAAPQGIYPCQGHAPATTPRWIALSVESETHWRSFKEWLGSPKWAQSIGDDLESRKLRQDDIDAELRQAFSHLDRDACIEQLVAAGIPAAEVVDPRTLSSHPQLEARRFLEELDHPFIGRQSTFGAPFRFESVSSWLRTPAPTLGQHNREILSELGYAPEEIDRLAAEGIIGERPEGL